VEWLPEEFMEADPDLMAILSACVLIAGSALYLLVF